MKLSFHKNKNMKTKQLGKTEIKLPPLAFGCNVFGWTADEKMSHRLLDELLERGFNYLDTANVYSKWVEGHTGGESETIIGNWMAARKNRDKVIVATKVGMLNDKIDNGLSKSNINEQIDKSLERLKTDYVDVYFSHKDEEVTPVLETLQTYNNLIISGKVRSIGASNFPVKKFKESQKAALENNLHRYEIYQPEYHLMERENFEKDFQQYCIDENIAVTGYFTLASGFLTGKYENKGETEGTSRADRLEKYFTQTGMNVLKELNEISKKHNVSEAAVTLAWTMNQPGITAPIASATKPEQLKSFYEAVKLELDSEDMERLSEVSEN